MSHQSSTLDALLAEAVRVHALPGVVAAVADRDGVLYQHAVGTGRPGFPVALRPDSVFWIASMTKAVTTAAAMQLVERGRLSLDAPVADVLPELGRRQVLEGFDAHGQPRLRAPRTAITLRHLLTHTSGLGYEWIDPSLARWCEITGTPGILSCQNATLTSPLLFDPGERWEYGIGIDWAGKVVEAVSGLSIGDYLEQNILGPLGMRCTSFKLRADQRSRLLPMHARLPDGSLEPISLEVPQEPEFQMGGGGLYATAGDYLRFARMILNRGTLDGVRILSEETVAQMATDQCPGLDCGAFGTVAPTVSKAADFFPGQSNGWGLSFLINRAPVPRGRSANSLAWAGLANSYYWIDPQRGLAGVIATQILPFFDDGMVELLRTFERAVYAHFASR